MWQRLKKLLGQVQHHCRICICLHGLDVNFVKCFSFVFQAVTVHEGQSMAEVGLCPTSRTSWQENISYGSTAPLHCGWAPACTQLRKVFLLAGMAINRALLEPRGDGHLPVHSVLKDKHDTISLISLGKQHPMFSGMPGRLILLETSKHKLTASHNSLTKETKKKS